MFSDCSCCSQNEEKPQSINCPNCKTEGKRIKEITIKSQLDISLLELKSDQYWFCRNPSCFVVYFNDNGTEIYKESDLKILVYQKHIKEYKRHIAYFTNSKSNDILSKKTTVMLHLVVTMAIGCNQ